MVESFLYLMYHSAVLSSCYLEGKVDQQLLIWTKLCCFLSIWVQKSSKGLLWPKQKKSRHHPPFYWNFCYEPTCSLPDQSCHTMKVHPSKAFNLSYWLTLIQSIIAWRLHNWEWVPAQKMGSSNSQQSQQGSAFGYPLPM